MIKHLTKALAAPILPALFWVAPGGPALAQTSPSPIQYVVVYGELAPDYGAQRNGRVLLDQLTRLARRSPGVQYFKVNVELGRPNFFTLVEVWQDAASLSAFNAATNTQQVLSYLQPLLLAPLDERDGNLVTP